MANDNRDQKSSGSNVDRSVDRSASPNQGDNLRRDSQGKDRKDEVGNSPSSKPGMSSPSSSDKKLGQ